MPKVKITEVDNTGAVQYDSTSNVVYIPGLSATGTTFGPKLYSSVRLFEEDAEKGGVGPLKKDKSYALAHRLLQLGLQVLYEGCPQASEEESGEDVTIVEPDFDRLADTNEYNIRFLTTGAYALESSKMIKCAQKRGDCVALLDHPVDTTDVAEVRKYFEDLVTEAHVAGVADIGTYCSAFSPWVYVKLDVNSDDISTLPGSAGFLLAYAKSAQSNPSWYATAGSYRGIIPGIVKPVVKYSKADCERLQSRGASGEVSLDDTDDNIGRAINPICNIRPFGYIVFGNRTLTNNEGTDKLKASAFLNVRNLVSTLKKELYFASNKYTFEQNSEVLWTNFKSQITPLLDKMQSGNGIEGYRLIKQATDKKARLKAKVIIVPIEAVEDFEIEVSLEDSLEVVEG